MRYYYLKPIKKATGPNPPGPSPILLVTPASLTLDRASPGNVVTFTASLDQDSSTAVAVTVMASDPSVSVSPAAFSLGGGNPVSRIVTVTGAADGPNAVTLSVAAPGQTTQAINVARPPIPLELAVTPASLVLDRVSPGNVGTFTASLNRVPESNVLVSVNSSDASVSVFPASFALSTGNPPARTITLTGAATGPSPVTITVNPLNLASKTVTVTRPALTPASIPNLALWYDAADASTITLDASNNISQWSDKSGNARHATQASAQLRPAWGTQTQNGKNLVVTDAAGLTRVATGSISSSDLFGTNRNTGTQFRVFRYLGGVLPGGWHRVDTAFLDTMIWRTDQFHYFGHGSFNDTAATVFGSNWFTANMGIYVASYNIAGQQVVLRRDKAAFMTLNLASNAAFNVTNMNWKNNWDAASATIYEAEMIHYNRLLTATEIAQVEDYLSAKWGL